VSLHVPEDPRAAALADGLEKVRQRIAAVCGVAGRSPDEVTIVGVTKTYPADDVVRLAGLGITEVGENRDQEAAGKAAEVAEAGAMVTWHFVGRLQRNKCRSVVQYAGVVHSIDRVSLATALGDAAGRAREVPLDALVQVSLDGDPARSGAVADGGDPETDLDRVLAAVAGQSALRLRGLMVVAPREWEPRAAFSRFQEVLGRCRTAYPQLTWASAGMSSDMESAIEHGSTHVRVGSALLGKRAPLR